MLAAAPVHPAGASGPDRLGPVPCRLRSRRMGKSLGVAGRAFIRRPNGSVLLLRRAAEASHGAGLWELPGGKIRHGEALVQSLAREVTEESGLAVEPATAVHVGHQRVDPFGWQRSPSTPDTPNIPVVLAMSIRSTWWRRKVKPKHSSVTDGTVEQVRAPGPIDATNAGLWQRGRY